MNEEQQQYGTKLSEAARRRLCAGFFAERFFVDPRPDADDLLALLDELGVSLEQMEALVEGDVGAQTPGEAKA